MATFPRWPAHANDAHARLETPRQALRRALLAADERLHDVHAGQPRQPLERDALADRAADRSGHRRARAAISFTPLARLYRQRFGNAAIVGGLTAFGDAYAHPNHYGFLHAEALLTGVISAVLAWVASYLLEDRARRIRGWWSRLRGRDRARRGDAA